MDDYIKRESALKACYDGFADCRDDCADNIRAIPAEDVAPVVRCRDCIYYKDYRCNRWDDGTMMFPHDYCSRAAKMQMEGEDDG